MSNKIFCDRCASEIIGIPTKLKINSKELDLCSTCKQAFDSFMDYMKNEAE